MKRSDLTDMVRELVLADTDDGVVTVTENPAPPGRRLITVFTSKEVRPDVLDEVQRAVVEHTPRGTTVDFGFSFIKAHPSDPSADVKVTTTWIDKKAGTR